MLDTENNFSNGSDYAERYGRKDFSTGEVVLGCTSVLITSLTILISTSIILLAIKKIKRAAGTLHFFFIANLMITDIGVAVIHNGKAIVNLVMTIADPMREGTDFNTVAVTAFPVSANTMTLAALCFDHLYNITAPHHHRRNMTKRKYRYIWLVSFSLSFASFLNPQ